MTPETCKQLLEMGILQAYAEGMKIEVHIGGTWLPLHSPRWDMRPEKYRIKPEPTFEVGDLVKVPSGCVYKVTQIYSDACEAQPTTDGSHIIVHKDRLTKVREIRTPFTFEQAVKACAEHGFKVRYGTLENSITELDYNSIYIDGRYFFYSKECLEIVFTSDNTPFCNISYEPTTTP